MSRLVDITGVRFNRLLVLSAGESGAAGARWNCLCDCGNNTIVDTLKLRRGHTKSCGCLKKETLPSFKHGLANKSRTYKTWKEMRNRCNNPKAHNYKWYGGKGITIATRWDDYTVFLSDMGDRPLGKTLDRLDSNGNYDPSNCRWATPKEQATTNSGCFKKRGA